MDDAPAEVDAEFYTIEEVADMLGVSTDTIRRRIRSGQLQAVKRPADIPGHAQRWYVPKRALGTQEITEVKQVPHALTRNDFEMMTARLEVTLNERDERTVQVIRSELGATLKKALDEQLRPTNRRIEGIDRTIRALSTPATPETISELQAQVENIRVELAAIKASMSNIGTVVLNAHAAPDNVEAPLPENEEEKPSRWQRFKF